MPKAVDDSIKCQYYRSVPIAFSSRRRQYFDPETKILSPFGSAVISKSLFRWSARWCETPDERGLAHQRSIKRIGTMSPSSLMPQIKMFSIDQRGSHKGTKERRRTVRMSGLCAFVPLCEICVHRVSTCRADSRTIFGSPMWIAWWGKAPGEPVPQIRFPGGPKAEKPTPHSLAPA